MNVISVGTTSIYPNSNPFQLLPSAAHEALRSYSRHFQINKIVCKMWYISYKSMYWMTRIEPWLFIWHYRNVCWCGWWWWSHHWEIWRILLRQTMVSRIGRCKFQGGNSFDRTENHSQHIIPNQRIYICFYTVYVTCSVESSYHGRMGQWINFCVYPNSKVHGANMGPTWGRQGPGRPHVGPMNLVIWARVCLCVFMCKCVCENK